MGFQIAYIPIGVGTFHLESAQTEFERSVRMLLSVTDNIIYPDNMLLNISDLNLFLDNINPDLIIIQNVTFANAAYTGEILKRFSCRILLWTLREPEADGKRLKLNSLTGAYSAANTITAFGYKDFEYVLGSPDEKEVQAEISAAVSAARVRYSLKSLKMASIGNTPQGFGFGRALDSEMLHAFGVTLESVESKELMSRALKYSDDDYRVYLDRAGRAVDGLCSINEKNVKDFARLYKAYFDYIAEGNIGAISSRCWPDFFIDFGTPVCSVLSLLNDDGICAACEADTYGALSMYIGKELTGKPAFFGDPVAVNDKENTVTFWHCGMAACSLARKDTKAAVGLHPNRKLGPVMDFGCESCESVTVFRIGRKPDGKFRFFVAGGTALDKPKQYTGTSVVVQTKNSAKDIVYRSIKQGWEPHFTVIYGNVYPELIKLAHMLDMQVCEF